MLSHTLYMGKHLNTMQFSCDLCDYYFILCCFQMLTQFFQCPLLNPGYIGSGNTKLPGDFSLGTGLHPEKAITQLHHRLFLGL